MVTPRQAVQIPGVQSEETKKRGKGIPCRGNSMCGKQEGLSHPDLSWADRIPGGADHVSHPLLSPTCNHAQS